MTVLGMSLSVFVWADEDATAYRFELAKRSEPELVAFLKEMPKGADLHNHVTGAIYSDYMLDHAVREGLYFNTETSLFQREASDQTVPAHRLTEDWGLYRQFMQVISMHGSFPAIRSGHNHFFDTFRYIGPANIGRDPADILFEVVQRNRTQNVQYLELMTSVTASEAMAEFMRDLPPVEDLAFAFAVLRARFERLVEASRLFLDERDRKVEQRMGDGVQLSGSHGPINTRYIHSVNRLAPLPEFFASMAVGMAMVQADRRVVGINIVAPEDFVTARINFDRQMEMIDFLWQRMDQPNLTLHAGELTLEISPYEVMRNRIRKTIEVGRAKRIGHGISIAWEDDVTGLLRMMRERGILVEICLTSNASILKVEGDQHPIHLYMEHGVPISINTDDEGVSRSTLTQEFVRAVRTYDFRYPQIKEFIRNSIEYSFLAGESLFIDRTYTRLRPGFEGVRSRDWTPDANARSLMANHDKLAIQVRLERAFVEFENQGG